MKTMHSLCVRRAGAVAGAFLAITILAFRPPAGRAADVFENFDDLAQNRAIDWGDAVETLQTWLLTWGGYAVNPGIHDAVREKLDQLEFNATQNNTGSYAYTIFASTPVAISKVRLQADKTNCSFRLMLREAGGANRWYYSGALSVTTINTPTDFPVNDLMWARLSASEANLNDFKDGDEAPLVADAGSASWSSLGITNIDGGGICVVTGDNLNFRFDNITWVGTAPAISLGYPKNAADQMVFWPKEGPTAGWGRVIVSNSGVGNLDITSITLADNAGGAFSIVSGGDPVVLTPAGGTTPTAIVNLAFAGATDALGTLRFTSNDGGAPGTPTDVSLNGSAGFTVLTWDGGTNEDFATAANWNPDTDPTSPSHHLRIDDFGNPGRIATSDKHLSLGLPGYPALLTVTGGELLTVLSPARDLNLGQEVFSVGQIVQTSGSVIIGRDFNIGNAADAQATFTLQGGTFNATRDLIIANAARAAGATIASGGVATVGRNTQIGVGASGVLSLGANAQFNGTTVNVGASGAGTLNLGGNALLALPSGTLRFGSGATGRGSFNMSGGTLSCNRITTGPGAVSSWSWTGGTMVANTISLPTTVTQDGGTLAVGGVGTTGSTVLESTTFDQRAGGKIAIDLSDTGAADQLVSSNTVSTLNGTIEINLLNGGPVGRGSWDVVATTGGGSLAIGAVTVTGLTGPNWAVTSDSTRITVRLLQGPMLATDLTGPVADFPTIFVSQGVTSSTRSFTIQNVGDLDLRITTMTVAGTSFTLVQPAVPPDLTLMPGTTESVVLRFDNATSGTYTGSLTIDSNDPNSPAVIGLRCVVQQEPTVASGVESWVRY